MSKWRLKACPRCHGDVYIAHQTDGWYEECLQCSCTRDLRDISEFNKDLVNIINTRKIDFEDWNKPEES